MKQNQKIAILVVSVLFVIGFWQSVQALTPEELKNNFETKRIENQERIEERQEVMETKRIENQERVEEKKEEMQEKRAEIRERRQERFQKISERITTKFENIVDKLEEAGIDTTTIESYLEELASKNTAVEDATASLDEAYDSEDKDAIQSAHENVKTAVASLRDYYQNTLRPAIKSAVEEARS